MHKMPSTMREKLKKTVLVYRVDPHLALCAVRAVCRICRFFVLDDLRSFILYVLGADYNDSAQNDPSLRQMQTNVWRIEKGGASFICRKRGARIAVLLPFSFSASGNSLSAPSFVCVGVNRLTG